MGELRPKKTKIEDTVVGAYQKIEDTVVGTYQKIEDTVVNAYQKIEDKLVEKFIEVEEEVIEIPLFFSISIQSETAWRSDALPLTEPAVWIAPP